MERDSDQSFRARRLSSLRSFDNTGKDLEANNAHEFHIPLSGTGDLISPLTFLSMPVTLR